MTENHFTINTEKLNPVLLFKISGLLRRYAPRNDGEMSTAPSADQYLDDIETYYSEISELSYRTTQIKGDDLLVRSVKDKETGLLFELINLGEEYFKDSYANLSDSKIEDRRKNFCIEVKDKIEGKLVEQPHLKRDNEILRFLCWLIHRLSLGYLFQKKEQQAACRFQVSLFANLHFQSKADPRKVSSLMYS